MALVFLFFFMRAAVDSMVSRSFNKGSELEIGDEVNRTYRMHPYDDKFR